MRSDHVDALWNFFTTGRTQAPADPFRAASHDEALAVLDVSEAGPFSRAKPEGTAEDSELARYFTVKLEVSGRTRYVHITALNTWAAGSKSLRENKALSAQVVREISRAEFERLTRVPQ